MLIVILELRIIRKWPGTFFSYYIIYKEMVFHGFKNAIVFYTLACIEVTLEF